MQIYGQEVQDLPSPRPVAVEDANVDTLVHPLVASTIVSTREHQEGPLESIPSYPGHGGQVVNIPAVCARTYIRAVDYAMIFLIVSLQLLEELTAIRTSRATADITRWDSPPHRVKNASV